MATAESPNTLSLPLVHPAPPTDQSAPLTDVVQDHQEPLHVDAFDAYMRSIPNLPLLTHDQEVDLAKRIEAGDRDASIELTLSNLRLVVALAKSAFRRNNRVPLLDLIQEGNVGLLHAAQRYDWRLGHRFSTFATYAIRQHISRAVMEQADVILKTTYMHEIVRRFRRMRQALIQELGSENPPEEELAQAMGVSVEQLRVYLAISDLSVVSLATPLSDDEEPDTIEDTVASASDTEEEALRGPCEQAVRGLLPTLLTEREMRILSLHIAEGRSLEEVGKELQITRQRAHQIESKAIRRLNGPLGNRLRELYEP